MKRRLATLLLVFISCVCWGQQKVKKSAKVKPTASTSLKQDVSLNVLFATNEDCELFINEISKGQLLKSNFLYLQLQPGKYQYRAVDKTGAEGDNFIMGNNRAPSKDETEHRVSVHSFLASKYEVTQNQWEVIMGYNPSLTLNCPTCPVDNVSWEEVIKFIHRLNSLSNRNFRLPTEAEWEYLAKLGGRKEIDAFGGQEEYIKKTAWNFINADKKTHPVGTKEPNAAGIYDLTGNVSEWCADWYSPDSYKMEMGNLSAEGPKSGKERVVRGGNYKDFIGDRFRPSFR
ncbi:MAG: hypothetical protein EON98_08840, partial [Chitinophagaceae bacterium]